VIASSDSMEDASRRLGVSRRTLSGDARSSESP